MPLIIFIIIGFLFFVLKSLDDNKPKQIQKQTCPNVQPQPVRAQPKTYVDVQLLNIEDDDSDGNYETKINGLSHHCTKNDEGVFDGVIFNERTNKYDSKAMAVANMKGKIIGYVPAYELKDYHKWSNKKPCTCVGFIRYFIDENGEEVLFGRVTAIKPCNKDFVNRLTEELHDIYEEELESYKKKG